MEDWINPFNEYGFDMDTDNPYYDLMIEDMNEGDDDDDDETN